jgi:Flp pilus assembly protein protease CpaA
VYIDSVKRKIPNFLSVALLVSGLIFAIFSPRGGGLMSPSLPGSLGWKVATLSVGITFVFSLFLFAFKLWGAGDGKLLIGLAVWLPLGDLPLLLLLTALSGGFLAIFRMFGKRNAKEVFSNLQTMMFSYAGGARLSIQSADRMPFSWAIALAWVGLMFLKLVYYT